MSGKRIKENDGEDEFNNIVTTFVIVAMYPQYNNIIKIKVILCSFNALGLYSLHSVFPAIM
jgi:hypothetical protein